MKLLPILTTKIASSILQLFGRGGSLPGSIARKMNPDILKTLSLNGPVILVTGTNGKTTTSNMIADLLIRQGYHVISNRKGDNLREGITTTLLTHAGLNGRVNADAVVLEVDELNIRHILPQLPVTHFVVNNFFRDQLDRAREMEQLIESIESVLPDYDQTLVLNGNDPNVVRLSLVAKNARCYYFGMKQTKYSVKHTDEASEGKFCPKCGAPLAYDYYQYSHIGSFHCTKCDFETPVLDVEIEDIDLDKNTLNYKNETYPSPHEGMFTMYNCGAVFSIAELLNIPMEHVQYVFSHAPQPKGRNETFVSQGKKCILNLIKNPTGANEVLKVIETDSTKKSVCIVLNDNDQDGTDISWIYDTFFEKLMNEQTVSIVCSGSRAYDMALRIDYGGFQGTIDVKEEIPVAVAQAVHDCDNCYVIATYTALLPTRNAILKELPL
ncbi:MAG: DUF1727 domain-containing protein [Erysipelotrichaceae bacterium]|nr:DUF1727 domain-containing protein [Erysipelotrichaceae bacterium]